METGSQLSTQGVSARAEEERAIPTETAPRERVLVMRLGLRTVMGGLLRGVEISHRGCKGDVGLLVGDPQVFFSRRAEIFVRL